MSGMNKVILIGNVGKDPEVRSTQSGDKIANLSVATSEVWTDRASGERRERTEWHKVSIFGKLAEIAEKYIHKGSKVALVGKLQTRKWQDQSGADRYTTEVVVDSIRGEITLLDRREDGGEPRGGGGGADRAAPPSQSASRGSAPQSDPSDLDDEVPF